MRLGLCSWGSLLGNKHSFLSLISGYDKLQGGGGEYLVFYIINFIFKIDCSYLASQSRSGQAKPEKKGLGFSILHDSDDSENRMSRLPEGRGNEWKEAPVEAVMSKENVNMPGKWTGEHVR